MRDDELYPVKAKLTNQDDLSAQEIIFQFNPTQISISREVTWGGSSKAGANSQGSSQSGNVLKPTQASTPVDPGTGVDIHGYARTSPYTVSLTNVLFDTFEDRTTVDKYILELKKTVTPSVKINAEGGSPDSGKKKRPPTYLFTFGTSFDFVCAVQKLSWVYSVWLPDGTPLRALVSMVLQETTLKTNKSANPGRQNSLRVGSRVIQG